MQKGNTAVYGIFPNRTAVENAVADLKASGFRHEDVSILFSSPEVSREFAVENSTKAPEGAVTGATTGAVLGGALGWLAGIGAIAIPGVGPLIAAGPIMGLLAGAGIGGTVGTVSGALIGMGIPEYEASRYEGRVKDGGVLLSVHSDDSNWTSKAKEILARNGGEDIDSKSEISADKTTSATERPITSAHR